MEPGFFEKVFLGVDENLNGQLEAGEKGILPTVIDWIGQIGMYAVNGPLDAVVAYLPNSATGEVALQFKQALYFINQWYPFDTMITYLILYFTSYFILTIGHFILKAIPTIW